MQDPGIIATFAESLAGRLNFDSALSQRVRQEIQDHLYEAAAAAPSGDGGEALQRAIANFGDPHVIAAQFAAGWLARQAWKVGIIVTVVITCDFVTMKTRLAWYAAMRWVVSDDVKALAKAVGLIGAGAFYVAVIVGIAACAYLVLRRAPSTLQCATPGNRLRHVLFLSGVSAAALSISVIGDGVLTTVRLAGKEIAVELLVPMSSMVIEIVCTGILIFSIRTIVARMVHAAALLET